MSKNDLLENNLFNNPAKKEYFTQLFIQSVDSSGKEYMLILHAEDKPIESYYDIGIYCDKVRVGETLSQSVKRSLRNSFGISNVIKIEDANIHNSAQNKHGETLPRYGINVLVPLEQLKRQKVTGLYTSWEPHSKIKMLEYTAARKPTKKVDENDLDEVITKMEELEYFKYVSDRELDDVRKMLKDDLLKGEFRMLAGSPFQGYESIDGRSFPADEEELFDGFMSKAIVGMKSFLEHERVNLEKCRDEITEDNSHYLILNDKKHEIYKYEEGKTEYDYYGVLHTRLLEIVNELLLEAGSHEKLYGQFFGNDGAVIFLTEELFKYISNLPIDEDWKPYESDSYPYD